ncbi:MAG: MBL fold metallo-hydrolase [Rhodoferax sp.]|nr:MBL fold metallo-hydrolase [Actinomycetota bacterium]
MTLDGTNTWVLAEPGSDVAVVVDPGPDDVAHLRAVLAVVQGIGARVGTVLLTHGHADHSAGAAGFAAMAGCGVQALDPAHRLGDEGLRGGDVVAAGGLRVEVVGTPGHSADSLSFVLADDAALLTGDTVLGRGTTVVAHPDGRLDDYLASLDLLQRNVSSAMRILPGHGPVLDDAAAVLAAYQQHRRERLEQVRAAVAAGAATPGAVVRTVYADVDPALWPAAGLSGRAPLGYLRL